MVKALSSLNQTRTTGKKFRSLAVASTPAKKSTSFSSQQSTPPKQSSHQKKTQTTNTRHKQQGLFPMNRKNGSDYKVSQDKLKQVSFVDISFLCLDY